MPTKYLLTPGPVELPQEVLRAAARPMISHRCEDFSELLTGISDKLNRLLESEGPVIILPSSGTGALEALAVNFLDGKSRFLSVSCGAFGDRFRDIALRTGARGEFVDVAPGEGVAAQTVAEALAGRGECDALLLTHNETSTGVLNPIRDIVQAIPPDRRPFILVDGVSSVGAMECFPQEWGVDGLATASQKGLMTPPGLGFVWLSPRAWQRLDGRSCPSWYFDLKLHRKELEGKLRGNPYTPPVSLYYALDEALGLILRSGAAEHFAGRCRYARALAAGLVAMGFELLVKEEKYRSPGVTAVKTADSERIRSGLRGMGIEAAAGQGTMKNQLIRLAHYHDCGWTELSAILGALSAAAGITGKNGDCFIGEAWKAWSHGEN